MTDVTFLPYAGAQPPYVIPETGLRVRTLPTLTHRYLIIDDGFPFGYNAAEERAEGVHGAEIIYYAAKRAIGDYAPQCRHYSQKEFMIKYLNSNFPRSP